MSLVGVSGVKGRPPARLLPILCTTALLVARAAPGTTFIRMDESTVLRTSVAVVVGTVTRIESAAPTPDGPISTYVQVQVDRVIKGQLHQGSIVLR